jgi:hypothetical protein
MHLVSTHEWLRDANKPREWGQRFPKSGQSLPGTLLMALSVETNPAAKRARHERGSEK